jgi:hypothetical protein
LDCGAALESGGFREAVAIEVRGEKSVSTSAIRSLVLVAKFTPAESSRLVVLVAGQSSVANLAAIHFLRREYARVAGDLPSV